MPIGRGRVRKGVKAVLPTSNPSRPATAAEAAAAVSNSTQPAGVGGGRGLSARRAWYRASAVRTRPSAKEKGGTLHHAHVVELRVK